MSSYKGLCISTMTAISLCLSAGFLQAGIYKIDDFQDGLTNMTVYDGLAQIITIEPGLEVAGGERYSEVNWTSGSDDVKLRINRNSSGVLTFAEDPSTRGFVKLIYGYSNDMNLNLSSYGQAIRFDFTTADLAGMITVDLFSSSGSSTASISTPSGLSNGYESVLMYFSSFATTSGTGADTSDVDRIAITIFGVNNGDYVLSAVTVPEPATLAMLCAGCLVMLKKRRK